MNLWMIGVAAATLGINASWQPLPEGGVEYIIQLDSQSIELLRSGMPLESYIPAEAGNVRSYRIISGTQTLPPRKSAVPNVPKLPPPLTLPSDPGGKPIVERSAMHTEPFHATTETKPSPKNTSESQPQEPAKPWLPLTFALLGLFASIGANIFLGWVVWDSRQQMSLKNG